MIFLGAHMKRVAIIDIGSESITLSIAEYYNTKYKVIERVRGNLSLGYDTYTNKRISEESTSRLIEILKFMKEKALREFSVKDIEVFASSAIREADNKESILFRIKHNLGLTINILSNTDERYYNLLYIRNKDLFSNKYLDEKINFIELGAGSLQISYLSKNRIKFSDNIRIGALRVASIYSSLNDVYKSKQLIIAHILQDLSSFKILHQKDLSLANANILFLHSPHLSYLLKFLAIKELDEGKFSPNESFTSITQEEFKKIEKKLNKLSDLDLSIEYAIPAELMVILRSDILIIRSLLNIYSYKEIVLCMTSFADSYLTYISLNKKDLKLLNDIFIEDLKSQCDYLLRNFSANHNHSDTLCEILDSIFPSIKRNLKLKHNDKLILQLVAKLHDIGKVISLENHAEYSRLIMRKILPYYLGDRDYFIAEEIVRQHSCEETNNSSIIMNSAENLTTNYINKDSFDYDRFLLLLAIFRVIDSLDASEQGKIIVVDAKINKGILEIKYKTETEDVTCNFEEYVLNKKKNLFLELSGIDIKLIKGE